MFTLAHGAMKKFFSFLPPGIFSASRTAVRVRWELACVLLLECHDAFYYLRECPNFFSPVVLDSVCTQNGLTVPSPGLMLGTQEEPL